MDVGQYIPGSRQFQAGTKPETTEIPEVSILNLNLDTKTAPPIRRTNSIHNKSKRLPLT